METDWINVLTEEIKNQPLIQWAGISFGVAEVLLARANKIWLYPCGIISIAIALYTLFTAGLYAETCLNIYYMVMSIYGWWFWLRRKATTPVPVTVSTRSEWKTAIWIVLISMAVLYVALSQFTDSTVPVWDAWVSATAWAGMWLLAKRKLENWIFLNISNAFAIPLLFHKNLPLYGFLTIFLFLVAIQGYFQWKKIIKREKVQVNPIHF